MQSWPREIGMFVINPNAFALLMGIFKTLEHRVKMYGNM